ncbi:FtsK/SpoIIIE domain-containing protein [Desulfosporosinus lacus]|uniref:FtsK/SpoIIIE family protein n=1 Tax=Desulfosporosinus lacus DSM 15449 TaxID=1121420 RepID=A0A1M5WF19_9FIRM|nr:FtsK/SpoIIIE domain-containing protein [Desulfosporosinus lacus]SHH86105.1 FtsK/SpoIIIE family protein [Desulfosporosinus lacus DSM 15449]
MPEKTVKPDILGLTASLITWGIKQFKGKGIQDVIEAVHLQNKEGQRPILRKKHPTDNGIDYVFALPAGVDRSDFERERHYFESYLNSIVEFEAQGRKLILKTYKANFKKKIPFDFNPSLYPEMFAPFPVGKTPDGKTLVEDLYNLPHMMVGGQTGYGKTSFLLVVMVACLLSGVKVSVVDRKGVDFPRFAPWVNLALTDADTEVLLQQHIQEMHRRQRILREAECQNFAEYAEHYNDLPYLVLFIDELTQIRNKACFEAIGDMSVLSRVSGISMILATQKPGAKIWDGFTDVRSQLSGAMCFRVRDQTDSQIVLGSGNTRGAELPKIKGRAVWNNDQDQIVQSMYLTAKEAYSVLMERVSKGVYSFANASNDECTERIDT